MKNLSFTLYQNNYHNCGRLATSAMLKRLNVPLNKIWGQSGLFYKVNESGFKISPYFRHIISEFENYGIFLTEERFTDFKECYKAIKRLIDSGKTVALETDIYELPYCIYYQDHHELHEIEIVDIVGDELIICDHYYHYYGPIKFLELEKNFNSCRDHITHATCKIYSFEVNYELLYKNELFNFKRVIDENLKVMSGVPVGDLIEESTKENNKEVYIGISAIEPIGKIIEKAVQMDKEAAAWQLYEVYRELKETANSRYNFHVLLNSYSFPQVGSAFSEISQDWSVAANLTTRSMVTENFENLYPRIKSRFEKVIRKEESVLKELDSLLKNI
ncbi:BtrH N-terminal domain-containing protein [Cytobacillus pseudoceanisediminis]|uniref:BtrH N-terminal domain-containing protein n=1 Tax=Cytobacillus pseudoceanisediminis TaxID=3051614 RepID=UPI003C30CA7B